MEERLLALLRLALKYQASDIHFTVKDDEVDIEIRIDGYLRKVKTYPGDRKLIRYLQYLANLDAGIMIPQTGQFEMDVDDVETSLRFAVISKPNYSNAVLRILNRNEKKDELCENKDALKKALDTDHGLLIVSGEKEHKALYSILKLVEDKKIYTIENPIEIYCDEFIQLSVNEEMDFGFVKGIKQIMRREPDIIMVSDISDPSVARAAMHAADSGFVVVAGLDKPQKFSDVIEHLINSGISEELLIDNIIGVYVIEYSEDGGFKHRDFYHGDMVKTLLVHDSLRSKQKNMYEALEQRKDKIEGDKMYKEITWSGRLYVDEKQITPEQYKMFFARLHYGIAFDAANSILKRNSEGNFDEIVPGDELDKEIIADIKWQLITQNCQKTKNNKFKGEVEYKEFILHWVWNPKFTDENGDEHEWQEFDLYTKNDILSQMLDNESHWGVVYC